MSDALDPLGYLLQSARRVGDEFCWPATQLLNVTRSFVALNLIILGVELRRFDEGTAEPTVIGWTEYEIPDADW